MRITLVQMDVHFAEPTKNLQSLEQLLAQEENLGDLILLPELFTTGYLFDNPKDLQNLAESTTDGPTVKALITLARRYNQIFVAGIAERASQHCYNTAVIVNKDGVLDQYRKIALTSIDKPCFSRGQDIVTFQVQGLTIGVVICFDLWFPEVIRQYTQRKTDILLHLANFGGEQTLHMGQTRAMENRCYICTCNRVGSEKTKTIDGFYRGNSQIINPKGEIIFQANQEAAVHTIEIDSTTASARQFGNLDLLSEIKKINKLIS